MPFDPDLAATMRSALVGRNGVTEKKMFGGICFFLNGNMLCGVEVGRYMFRVGKEQEAEAVEKGAEVMTFNGRRMGGITWVTEALCQGDALREWLAMAERFAGTLPPK